MMYPPIFEICASYAPLADLITGEGVVRFFPFGQATVQGGGPAPLPYVVWQQVGGSPSNYLGDRPDIDSFVSQIDVYAATAESAREVAIQVRNAIEGDCYVTA